METVSSTSVGAASAPSTATPSTANDKAARAKEYVVKLQRTLSPESYNNFLSIMSRFKKRQLTKRGLIAEVDELFSDLNREDLIHGFEVFLPAGVTVDMIREGNSKCSTFSDRYSSYGASLEESTKDAPTATTAPAAEPADSVPQSHLSQHHLPKRANSTQDSELSQPHKKLHFEPVTFTTPTPLFDSPIGSLRESTTFPTLANPWSTSLPSTTTQKQPSPPRTTNTDEAMVDFTYKLQLALIDHPDKYARFLSLLSESRVSPSSYPAAIYQATQLLKEFPELLDEFKGVIARVSFAGLLPPSPTGVGGGGGGIVTPPGGVSSKRGHHRKSKSLGTWNLGGVGAGSGTNTTNGTGGGGGGHSRRGSESDGAGWSFNGSGGSSLRSSPKGKGETRDVRETRVDVGSGVTERTPLLMTYDDWCAEHARRSLNNDSAVSGTNSSGSGSPRGWTAFWRKIGGWAVRGGLFVAGVVGCGVLVLSIVGGL
ncbi:hypothetical protein HDU79_006914 [Rhizoclosmatium sp. JEL0117]|nr:hypothetical protein HDU79_006914 [Rhizoclosmatium sp. JEL0117]